MKVLKQWINEINVNDFFETYWGNEKILYKLNQGITIPFDLKRFERILFSSNLHYPQVKLFDNGGTVDVRLYTESNHIGIDSKISQRKLLQDRFLQGKTIVINNLQNLDSAMNDFLKQIETMFGCKANINAYYTNGPARGANPHYDLHHIFAVQLHGQKEWKVGPIMLDSPHPDHHQQFVGEHPSFSSVYSVKKGEILYMPPGMWHDVETTSVSLHLAIGLQPPTWYSYMQDVLTHAMKKHSIIRASTPFTITEGHCTYREDLSDELHMLFDLVKDEIPESFCINKTVNKELIFLPSGEILQQSQLPIDDENLLYALNDLWSLVPHPVSMYIRGSFSQKEKTNEPWDIDIILIHKGNIQYTKSKVRDFLHEKYIDLTTIDINFVPLEEIYEEEWTLIRLLLLQQSVLIYGEELKEDFTVEINDDTLSFLKNHFKTNLLTKLNTLQSLSKLSEQEEWYRTRTIAKSALRCIGIHLLKEKQQLIRDPIECQKLINKHFPGLVEAAGTMMNCIKQQDYNRESFIKHSYLLIERLVES
ncbi:hypothetical protein CN481_15670 [Bacillus sp. AFS006103]|nr:hypothetical protein CN481_15670 [Bacillus sp. AFS006103]